MVLVALGGGSESLDSGGIFGLPDYPELCVHAEELLLFALRSVGKGRHKNVIHQVVSDYFKQDVKQ